MHIDIENLIKIALADGVVTEKERAIILRKAETLGEDQDEIEMILDGKIAQLKNEKETNVLPNTFPAPPIEKKSQKEGDLKKCPACGSTVNSFQVACKDCGHEFRNIDANNSVKQLEIKLNKIKEDDDDYKEKVSNVIKNHPIPNSKEDLFEMLSYMSGKVLSSDENNTIVNAYHGRAIEVINKLLFMPDVSPAIIKRVEAIQEKMEKYKKKNSKNMVLLIIGTLALMCFVYYMIYLVYIYIYKK